MLALNGLIRVRVRAECHDVDLIFRIVQFLAQSFGGVQLVE